MFLRNAFYEILYSVQYLSLWTIFIKTISHHTKIFLVATTWLLSSKLPYIRCDQIMEI